jgi:AbiV family abortive infection protein
MPVTAQYLLEGAAYSLEQCGLLLRDANILYRSGSYSSAIALTAFAREELGRYKILLDLRSRALAGETFTTKDLQKHCDDHVAKQRAGMLSITIMTNIETGLGRILQARMQHHPQTKEWQEADAELNRIQEMLKKRTPNDRHEKRMAALYVEPISETEWNRPGEATQMAAYEFLQGAVNDYSLQFGQHYITGPDPMVKHINPELYSALEQWPERPALQPPEHLPYPASKSRDNGSAN